MTKHTDAKKFLQAVFPDHTTKGVFANSDPVSGMRHSRSLKGLDSTRDCYWSVASFPDDGVTKRTTKRALDVRALVVDDVGTKVPPMNVLAALGAPTAVVETSSGNFQYTYRLTTPVPVAAWGAFFASVEAAVGQKLEGRDAVHLFRLPMGVNTKPGRNGFAVRLAKLDGNLKLSPSAIFSGLAASGPGPSAAAPERRIRNIKDFMDLIPNPDVDYDAWIARAHQVKALALDEAEGEEAFDAWSRKSSKYDADETARRWATVEPSRTSGLDLLRDAEAADHDGFTRAMNADAREAFNDDPPPPPSSGGGGGGGRYAATHRDMAEEISTAERGRLGWLDGAAGSWAVFDDVMRRWVVSTNDAMMHAAVKEEIARRLRLGVEPAVSRAMHKAGWHHSVASLVRVEAGLKLRREQFDANDNVLGLPGKVLEMDASGLGLAERAGGPGDFITRSCSTIVAPAGARGKYWEKFLTDFTGGDAELRRWWQLFCGYCLSGHTGEHVVVFVYGPGGNGKSVFLDMIGEVMGDYHARADHRLFMSAMGTKHLAPLAVLEGARLVTVPDVAVGATWDMGLVKQVSGGGAVTANRMRQDPVTYIPRFKVVMAGNEKPRMDAVDDGVRRRMRLVPALFRPKAVDVGLVDKLRGEKGEILRWMVDGWLAWAAGGLPACKTIDEATSEYLDAADVFGRWLGETLKVAKGDRTRHHIEDLWNSWDAFRTPEGAWKITPVNKAGLSTKLKEAGFKINRDEKGAYIDEISVKKSVPSGF